MERKGTAVVAAEATTAADTDTEAVPGPKELETKPNVGHLLQMPQARVW